MLRKLVAAAAWACLLFIIYATLSSYPGRPRLPGSESEIIIFIERFSAYALLGYLFRLTYPRHIAFVCLIVLGGAILLEVLQIFVPDRDARTLDAVVKLAGGFLGIFFAHATLMFSGHRGWKI
jgi:VanZ family protein